MERRYPVGIQTFSEIIEDGYVYVDKTDLVYRLCHKYKAVFLSRPRRFGKSLLVSTLKEYFSGNKKLFSGLKIDSMEKDWIQYPVFLFNMSRCKKNNLDELKSELFSMLHFYEKIYGTDEKEETLTSKLTGLIERAHQLTGKKVVIIIDEYDAPLLNVIYEKNMDEIRRTMRSFYSPIKDCDEHIKFSFMTGITKFSQLSIFSELNNLAKISMFDEFSSICGITEDELSTVLKDDIQTLANTLDLSYEQTFSKIKKMYDGYHFSKNSPDIYNPFSLLNCLASGQISNFWFDSATPTFLLKSINKFNFQLIDTENLQCQPEDFDVSASDLDSAIPLLYQSGYLTIKNYDHDFESYRLDFPNDEVRHGLVKSLYPSVFPNTEAKWSFWIGNFINDIRNGNVEDFMKRITSLISAIPYPTGKNAELITEQSVQNGIFLIFNLMGQFTISELHTLMGRSDCIVECDNFIYLFEFKLSPSSTADEALKQIDKKGYSFKYQSEKKTVIKIGAAFDKETRNFSHWKWVRD